MELFVLWLAAASSARREERMEQVCLTERTEVQLFC